jgi:DNA-binding MarR family transcriptional regulator
MNEDYTRLGEQLSILPRFFEFLHFGTRPELEIKLNMTEEHALLCLYRKQGCSMSDYSAKLGLEKGSFTTVAKSLEEKSLIRRVNIDGDKRKCALVLSPEGIELAKHLQDFFNKRIEEKLAHLDQQAIDELWEAVSTIASTFETLKKKG